MHNRRKQPHWNRPEHKDWGQSAKVFRRTLLTPKARLAKSRVYSTVRHLDKGGAGWERWAGGTAATATLDHRLAFLSKKAEMRIGIWKKIFFFKLQQTSHKILNYLPSKQNTLGCSLHYEEMTLSNELTYKTERDSWTSKMNSWLLGGGVS